MIHVDRSVIGIPKFFESDECAALREKAEAHFGGDLRQKRRFAFDLKRLRSQADEALNHVFHLKCAYCEQSLTGGSRRNFEHFRPKSDAVGFEDESSPKHYYWLFYEWENLYLACQTCNTNKRTQFPVAGDRAPPRADRETLLEERALLLDPCHDPPADYFDFTESGETGGEISGKIRAAPRARVRGWARGRADVTIDVLGLNRIDLTRRRRDDAAQLFALLDAPRDSGWMDEVLGRISDASEFSGLRRQLVARWLLERQEPDRRLLEELSRICPRELAAVRERRRKPVARGARLAARPKKRALREPRSQAMPEPEATEQRGVVHAASIEKVTLSGFKAIHRLEIAPATTRLEADIADHAPATQMGWLTLLGENGTGKSSVLQAVALALAGPDRIAADQDLEHPKFGRPGRFVMRGKRVARVELRMSTLEAPIRLKITPRKFVFESWEDPATFVRAYGATRLPPRVPGGDAPGPFDNLFDPFTPLVDVDAWLEDLSDGESGRQAARQCFEDLLGLAPEAGREIDRLRVDVDPQGRLLVDDEPLANLSSGYQTLIALAADIMAGNPQSLSDMQQAPGIILLDEVGAHLHPAWKMHIVSRLRTAFAGMQFLTSTHEPLCLRGHDQGEVAVVKRELSGRPPARRQLRVRLETDLPSPRKLRVDQLLTSKHFGLNTTIDPKLDAAFTEYYQLLSYRDEDLTPEQRRRRAELAESLRGEGVLGYTRRDQLVYEAIDRYLADEARLERERRGQGSEAKTQRRREVMRRVAELWRYARRAGGGSAPPPPGAAP